MTTVTSPLIVLNLFGALPEKLTSFLKENKVEIITRDQVNDKVKINFIFVMNEIECVNAHSIYKADKNEISFIALGEVINTKKFLEHNGRLVMTPDFCESELGQFILKKFFMQIYNIHMDEAFSGFFKETQEFKIVNHLASGMYLDELCNQALVRGFNIVSLRTFADHLIYYFTYLKQAGLAGIPYEFEYASNNEHFVVNVHVAVKNFVAEYMIDSFGAVNAHDPLQFLLGVVSRSCDFIDMTYVEKPGKLIFTASWNKKGIAHLKGMAFNNILTTTQALMQLERKIKASPLEAEKQIEQVNLAEDNKTKRLPGSILEKVISTDPNSILHKSPEIASNLMAFTITTFEQRYPDRSVNDMTATDLTQIVAGFPDQAVLSQISISDQGHLLDKIKQNNVTAAYDQEIQRVRDNLSEDDNFKQVISDTFHEKVATKVANFAEAEAINRILGGKEPMDINSLVKGSKDPNDPWNRISGGKEDAEEFVSVVKGMKDESKSNLMSLVKGSYEEKSGAFNFKSLGGLPKEEKDGKMTSFFQQTIKDIVAKADLPPHVKVFLEAKAPDKLKSQLEKYSTQLGRSFDNIDMAVLNGFKDDELPVVLDEILSNEDVINEFKLELESGSFRNNIKKPADSMGMDFEFQKKFKANLERRLEKVDGVAKENDVYKLTNDNVKEDKVKEVISEAMKETLATEYAFKNATREEIELKEKLLIKDLSSAFKIEENQAVQIVKDGTEAAKEKEIEVVVDNIFKTQPGEKKEEWQERANQISNDLGADKTRLEIKSIDQTQAINSLAENELLKKVKKFEIENKQLLEKITAMDIKLKAQEETQHKVNVINQKIADETQQELNDAKAIQDAQNNQKNANVENQQINPTVDAKILDQLKQGMPIDPGQVLKIEELAIKEKENLAKVQAAENAVRKLKIEASKREALFQSEINKANKVVKAKDLVVEKAKDTMKAMAQKKEEEVKGYKQQVEQLSKQLKDDSATRLEAQLKTVTKQLESTTRMADVYKNKLESFAKSMTSNVKKDNSQQVADENRTLQRLKIQLENKLTMELKEKKSLVDRLNKQKEAEIKSKTQVSILEAKLKEYDTQFRSMQEQMRSGASSMANQASMQQQQMEAALHKALQDKAELESKLSMSNEMMQKLNDSQDTATDKAQEAASNLPGGKEKQMEQSIKKLQQDLSKASTATAEQKKEATKLKSENTSLKNQIAALKKELEKLQKAKGGKKAA